MRIILAALLFIASCMVASAQGCGPTNPNCIVPTAPAGTSDNRAASTAFVQSSASGSAVKGPASSTVGDVPSWNNTAGTLLSDPANITSNAQDFYFGTGRPWCDPLAKGAKGDGSTSDTTAFNACITAMPNGGTLYVNVSPSGNPYCTPGFTISTNNIRVVFSSGEQAGAVLSSCGSTSSPLTLNGFADTIEHGGVSGPNFVGGVAPTNAAIALGSSCTECVLFETRSTGGVNTLLIQSADTKVYGGHFDSAYGGANVRVVNGGARFIGAKIDQNYPTGSVCSSLANWSGTSAVTANQCLTLTAHSNFVVQVTVSGTTGGSEPSPANYGTAIADGSATEKLLKPAANYYGLQCDTSSLCSIENQTDHTGPYDYGLAQTAGQVFIADGAVTGNGLLGGVFLSGGAGAKIVNSQISACGLAGCNGIVVGSSYQGTLSITNTNFFSNAGTNIVLTGGATPMASCEIADNHILGNAALGIDIGAAVTKCNIHDNVYNSPVWGSPTNWMKLETGASDYIFVHDEDINGAGSLTNNSTGTHNQFYGNTSGVTGSGAIVLGTAPTISSPVISSLSVQGTVCNDASGNLSTTTVGCANTVQTVSHGGTGQSNVGPHGLAIWEGTSIMSTTGPCGNNVPVTGQGASADPQCGGTIPVANGGTGQTSIAGIQATTNQGLLTFEISGVNFNSANTDNQINITLPAGFTRYRILSMIISGASASISTATFGVFSGTGGTGTVIVNSGTAITVTASAENTANNMQFITVNNNSTASYNFSSIQFRVVGAQGSAATANVAISVQPVS